MAPHGYRRAIGFSVSIFSLTFEEFARDGIRCRTFELDRVSRGDRRGLRRQQLPAYRGTARPDSLRARRLGETRKRAGEYSPAGGKTGADRIRSQIAPPRFPCLSGRRQEIQVAATTLGDARHDAGPIPREMEPAIRLSDGRAQLRGGAIGNGQAHRAWSDAEECRAGQEGQGRRAEKRGRPAKASK